MKNNNDVAMIWRMIQLNENIITIDDTFQLLEIYIYIYILTKPEII